MTPLQARDLITHEIIPLVSEYACAKQHVEALRMGAKALEKDIPPASEVQLPKQAEVNV